MELSRFIIRVPSASRFRTELTQDAGTGVFVDLMIDRKLDDGCAGFLRETSQTGLGGCTMLPQWSRSTVRTKPDICTICEISGLTVEQING